MNSALFYTLPLLPAGAFLGALVLLLVVPVFALAVLAAIFLVAIAVLVALAVALAPMAVAIVRLALRRRPSRSAVAPRLPMHLPPIRFDERLERK